MKQLPRISGLFYSMPWAILPADHAELGKLYQSYLRGTLPAAIASEGETDKGMEWEADHVSGIARIELTGIIGKRMPRMECGPPVIDLAELDRVLAEFALDDAIQTIVFDLNSPGGVAVGLKETCSRMRELALTGRRLVAYTDYQMCSAAYWLACACDEIYAAPTSIIGSIGTYAAGLDDSRAWEMEGLELVLAKSGELKAMGHPGKPWSDAEKQWLQDMVDRNGAAFRAWVTERRGPVPADGMQGQWFFAEEAPPRSIDGLYRDMEALLADLGPQ